MSTFIYSRLHRRHHLALMGGTLAMLLSLVACGDNAARPDAPPPGSPDANVATPDAPPAADAHVGTPDAHSVADATVGTPDAPVVADAQVGAADASPPDASPPDATPDAFPSPFAGGNGSFHDPFLIANQTQLIEANDQQYSASSFRVIADIDLTDVAMQPIGFANDAQVFPFTGTFDGGFHHISNWTYAGGVGCVGLFGSSSGLIFDLILDTPTITSGAGGFADSVGGIVGCNTGLLIGDSVLGG